MIYRINTKKFSLAQLLGLVAAFFCMSTRPVWADGTLGDIICNAVINTKPFANIFDYVAYTAGAFFTVQGIHHLKAHSENRQNNPMKNGLFMLGGAGLLFSIPSLMSTLILSFFTKGGDGTIACNAGGAGGGAQLDQMLQGLVSNIQGPIIALVSLIAVLSGIWMIVNATLKASRHGVDPRAHSVNSIISHYVFGTLLVSVGTSLDTILGSLFGSGTTANIGIKGGDVKAWQFVSAAGGSDQFANAIAAALTFFQIIGVIAFVRGLLIMKKVVEGGGNVTMAQGITHMCGGALAVNIAVFIKMMDKTFGTNLM